MPELVNDPDWVPGDPLYPVEHHVERIWHTCVKCATQWTTDTHVFTCPKCGGESKMLRKNKETS